MMGGVIILINAHRVLNSAHPPHINRYALSYFRENVTDGLHAEGDSRIAFRKSLRRSLCHIYAIEERI